MSQQGEKRCERGKQKGRNSSRMRVGGGGQELLRRQVTDKENLGKNDEVRDKLTSSLPST